MTGSADSPGPHIFSRFDGDLGDFRQLVLDMGQLALEQVQEAATAVTACDMRAVSRVRDNYRSVIDKDMDLLESNIQLLAIYQPVASDLRYLVMLSRTAYDLERIHQEALRLADLAEAQHPIRIPGQGCDVFDDVQYCAELASGLLAHAVQAVAETSEELALEVARRPPELKEVVEGALRRLATYILQDPRYIQTVLNATAAIQSLERTADHAVSIARNVIFAISGKDVRHLNALNLDRAFLRS